MSDSLHVIDDLYLGLGSRIQHPTPILTSRSSLSFGKSRPLAVALATKSIRRKGDGWWQLVGVGSHLLQPWKAHV